MSIAFILLLIATFMMWCGLKCRDDVIANKDALIDDMRANIAKLVFEREDLQRQVEMKNKQVDGHIRDNSILLLENYWLKGTQRNVDYLDAEGVVEEIEAWLEGKNVV